MAEMTIDDLIEAEARRQSEQGEVARSQYGGLDRLRMWLSQMAGGRWEPDVQPTEAAPSQGSVANFGPPDSLRTTPQLAPSAAARQREAAPVRRTVPATPPPNVWDQLVTAQEGYQKQVADAIRGQKSPEVSTSVKDMETRLAGVKERATDPYGPALSRAMAVLGAGLLKNRGNFGESMGSAVQEYYRAIDADKSLAREEKKEKKAEIAELVRLGLGDLNSRNAATTVENQKLLALAQAGNPAAIATIREKQAELGEQRRRTDAITANAREKEPSEVLRKQLDFLKGLSKEDREMLQGFRGKAEKETDFLKLLEQSGGDPVVAKIYSDFEKGVLTPAQAKIALENARKK